MTKLAPVIGITFFVQILVFFIGVGNNVILSRWLGPEMLGIYASAIVMIELVYKVVNPGLDTSAIYFISNKKFEFKKYAGTYLINMLVIIVLGILILKILPGINFISSHLDTNLIKISGNILAAAIYFFSFVMYEYGMKIPLGLQQFKTYNKIQIIKPVLLFVFLIIFSVLFNPGISTVLILTGISFIVSAIFYWRSAFPIKFKWVKEITGESVRYGLKVMAGNILQFLNYRADIIIIGYFLTQAEVGWYFIAVVIAERLLFLTQATATILLPAASSSEEQRLKTPILSRINFTVVLLGSVLIGISAFWIVPLLFSVQYANSVLPLVIILPGIISLSVSKLLSADLSARGLPQYSMYVSILNFILNISLNLLLIPEIGIAGAAVSSAVSYTAALIFQVYLFKKITHFSPKEIFLLKKEDLKKLKLV